MNKRVESQLHLMKKARALVSGTHTITSPVVYMWIASDASPSRQTQCIHYCEKYKIPWEITGDKASFSAILQQPDVAVIRLINPHFLFLIHANKEDMTNEK